MKLDKALQKAARAQAALEQARTEQAQAGRNLLPAPPLPSLATALAKMSAAAKQAEQAGDVAKAKGIHREICIAKLGARMMKNRANGTPYDPQWGPGAERLFKTTHTLGEDTQLGGV